MIAARVILQRHPLPIALAAGLISATGVAPIGAWPLTLVAFALLVWLVGGASDARSAAARGWWFGLGHFTLGLNWIAQAFTFQDAMPHWMGYVAVVGLSMYLALFVALAAWGTRRLAPASAATTALVFAGLWILTEYLRATLFTGFAWNPLASIWADSGPRGLTRWIGTYGLSGFTVLVAGLVASMLRQRGRPDAIFIGLFVAVAIVTAILPRPSVPLAVRSVGSLVRIIQPNIGQAQRNGEGQEEARIAALERLTGVPSLAPRLILWPEAAVPFFIEQEAWGRDRIARLLGPRDLIVTGGDALVYDAAGKLVGARNSVFAMTPDRRLLGRYDKAHLVPGGEYLPMRPLMSAIGLARLVPGDLDFLPGAGPQTLTLPGFGRVGMQLCYEMIFSGEVVDRANRPDFVFNPSNDAWFGSWGPPQHLAQARLRAVEEGLPVVRSTPTGISAVIDADVRLLAALPLGKPGFIQMRLPEPHPPTFFARHGNLVPLALALMLLVAGVAPGLQRRYGKRRT